MAVIERRVFYAKPGKAGEVVQFSRDMGTLLQRFDLDFGTRILTDYMSGRTDRVVVETEFESMTEFEAAYGKVMSDEATVKEFQAIEARMLPLIDRAEVEHWTIV